jgi:hypothetical protein
MTGRAVHGEPFDQLRTGLSNYEQNSCVRRLMTRVLFGEENFLIIGTVSISCKKEMGVVLFLSVRIESGAGSSTDIERLNLKPPFTLSVSKCELCDTAYASTGSPFDRLRVSGETRSELVIPSMVKPVLRYRTKGISLSTVHAEPVEP